MSDVESAARRAEQPRRAAERRVGDRAARRQAEERLRQSEQLYHSLVELSPDGIVLSDAAGVVFMANHSALQLFAIDEEGDVAGRHLSELFQADERRRFAQDAAKIASGGSLSALEYSMLRRDGTSFVAEVGLSALTDLAGGRTAFVCAVRDITERRRSREELVRSAQTLRRTMEGVIDAMSSAVERRDPYTAGHQRRVARLAVAIAAEMGLDEHTIDGIRLAAGVHDVGKISVPAEILSKPGRLLEGEFSLIKAHPEVGAEILRSIEFSWPIADIVIEHHERLDGTGYPHGLRGSEVRLEPRIIAVADVVEAMASHRPYRPSLGIEAALKEIETYAGLLYDSKVAHVCLRLFRERGFDLDGK